MIHKYLFASKSISVLGLLFLITIIFFYFTPCECSNPFRPSFPTSNSTPYTHANDGFNVGIIENALYKIKRFFYPVSFSESKNIIHVKTDVNDNNNTNNDTNNNNTNNDNTNNNNVDCKSHLSCASHQKNELSKLDNASSPTYPFGSPPSSYSPPSPLPYSREPPTNGVDLKCTIRFGGAELSSISSSENFLLFQVNYKQQLVQQVKSSGYGGNLEVTILNVTSGSINVNTYIYFADAKTYLYADTLASVLRTSPSSIFAASDYFINLPSGQISASNIVVEKSTGESKNSKSSNKVLGISYILWGVIAAAIVLTGVIICIVCNRRAIREQDEMYALAAGIDNENPLVDFDPVAAYADLVAEARTSGNVYTYSRNLNGVNIPNVSFTNFSKMDLKPQSRAHYDHAVSGPIVFQNAQFSGPNPYSFVAKPKARNSVSGPIQVEWVNPDTKPKTLTQKISSQLSGILGRFSGVISSKKSGQLPQQSAQGSFSRKFSPAPVSGPISGPIATASPNLRLSAHALERIYGKSGAANQGAFLDILRESNGGDNPQLAMLRSKSIRYAAPPSHQLSGHFAPPGIMQPRYSGQIMMSGQLGALGIPRHSGYFSGTIKQTNRPSMLRSASQNSKSSATPSRQSSFDRSGPLDLSGPLDRSESLDQTVSSDSSKPQASSSNNTLPITPQGRSQPSRSGQLDRSGLPLPPRLSNSPSQNLSPKSSQINRQTPLISPKSNQSNRFTPQPSLSPRPGSHNVSPMNASPLSVSPRSPAPQQFSSMGAQDSAVSEPYEKFSQKPPNLKLPEKFMRNSQPNTEVSEINTQSEAEVADKVTTQHQSSTSSNPAHFQSAIFDTSRAGKPPPAAQRSVSGFIGRSGVSRNADRSTQVDRETIIEALRKHRARIAAASTPIYYA